MSIELRNKYQCYGCSLCSHVCQVDAIEMKLDLDGFVYPSINKDKCINCGACQAICSKKIESNHIAQYGLYVFQADDRLVLEKSTSGGFVPTLAKTIISENGVYYGVEYEPRKGPNWSRIDNKSAESISLTSGSKYFQIPISDELIESVLEDIKHKNVMFVGTPCQVAAIKKVVPKQFKDNLLAVDIICGGTPSYYLEQKYIAFLQKRHKSTVVERVFRSKENGWSKQYISKIVFEDGSVINGMSANDYFTRAFTSGSFLRESCYNCEYTNSNRYGDITIGDAWGADELYDISHRYDGISFASINSRSGLYYFSMIKSSNKVIAVDDRILLENKPLRMQVRRPKNRTFAYHLLRRLPFPVSINIVCYKHIVKEIIKRG